MTSGKKAAKSSVAKVAAKTTAIKDNILTIDQMMRHPDDVVFLLNNSGIPGTIYPQKMVFNLPFMVQDKAINVAIAHSWLPLQVENIDKATLLKSPHFRNLYTRGVLQIIDPAVIDKIYSTNDAQDELARLHNIEGDPNVTATNKKQATISSSLKVLLDSGHTARILLAHLRNNKNWSRDDYMYIIENVKDNQIVSYARNKLEEM